MKMRTKGKRILSLALVLVVLLTLLPSGVLPVSSQGVEQTTSQTEKHPMIGKFVKLKSSYPWMWRDPTSTVSQIQANASKLPSVLVIIDVYQYSSTITLYQLDAPEGEKWPADHPDPDFTGKYWIESDKVTVLEPCETCGKLGCESGHENWCDICKVDDCPNDHLRATVTDSEGKEQTIFVTGDLPDGAKLEVSIPEIDDKKLPNVFDIKVKDANGNYWQPGSAVTISIPVSDPAAKFVDVIHIIDHKEAIHDGLEYWPIEGADEDVLSLLAPAIAASDKAGYVAVEIFEKISVADGFIEFKTNSFSIYELSGNSFVSSDKDETIEFENGLFDSSNENTVVGDPFYATPDTVFTFETSDIVTGNASYGTFFTVKEGSEYVQLGTEVNVPVKILGVTVGNKKAVQVAIDENTPAGTSLKILFKTNYKAILREIIIVRPVDIKFHANLPEGISLTGNLPEDRVLSATGDTRIVTDGKQAHYTIPTTIPTAKNPNDANDTYKFLGWNTSPGGDGTFYRWDETNKKFVDPDGVDYIVLTQNINLYAMWEQAECTVTFDYNNGTGTKRSETVKYGTEVAMIAKPERPGYIFLGWCATLDGSTTRYQPATEDKEADAIAVKSNVTLYALWGVEFTINAVGGKMEMQMVTNDGLVFSELKHGDQGFQVTSSTSNSVTTTKYYIVKPESAFAELVFRFIPSGDNKTIRVGSSGSAVKFVQTNGQYTGAVEIGEQGLTETTVINFNVEDKLSVSYDTKGGTPQYDTTLVDKGSKVNPSGNRPDREGYDFAGWLAPNGNLVTGDYTINEDTIFTAMWTPKKFEVTVVAGNGIASVTGSNKYDYSSPVTVTATVKPGYRFVNWVGSGVANSASREYTFLVPNKNVTLTANADAIEYTITYILEGGTSVVTSQKYTVNDVIQLPTPTKEGFKFTGWKVTAGNSEWVLNHVYSLDQLTIASGQYGDVTLTAQWHQETYTVTWIADGSKTEAYKIGETIKLPSNPSKVGYYFDGWDGYTEGMTMPDEDVTFTAKWVKINYSIEFLESNGTQVEGVETITFDIENVTELQLPTPEKGGSNFLGWYTTRDLTGKPCDLETLSQLLLIQNDSKEVSVKLYAKWEASVTSMTIKVEGCNTTLDPNQSFLFTVEEPDGVKLKVTVLENGSVTIHGVTIGQTYTVTMDNAWSWRYSIKNGTDIQGNDNVTSAAVAGNCVTFTLGQNGMLTFKVTRNTDKWLDGNAYYRQ